MEQASVVRAAVVVAIAALLDAVVVPYLSFGFFSPRLTLIAVVFAAAALMDLGRTVCLARVPRCAACPLSSRCPSRGRRFAPLRRQGPLEGSFRQRRARVLRLVAERPRKLAGLDVAAVDALERDGLVRRDGPLVRLP